MTTIVCIKIFFRIFTLFPFIAISLGQQINVGKSLECYASQKRYYETRCLLREYLWSQGWQMDNSRKKFKIKDVVYSSVWCHESKVSKMSCNFRNLCYIPKQNDFLFLLSPSSIISGIDNIKEIIDNLNLSSINGHNAFKIRLVTANHIDIISNIKWIENKMLLFSKFKPDNIFHVIHDDLLPIYFTLQELDERYSCQSTNFVLGLVDNPIQYEYDFMYSILFKSIVNLQRLDHDCIYCFNSSYTGVNKFSIWYDYGFRREQQPMLNEFKFNRVHTESFKDCFLKYFAIRNNFQPNYAVILSRKRYRKILNEHELLKVLQIVLDKVHLNITSKIVSIENRGMMDVIPYILSTKLLIGVHGAGMILALFMPKDSSVIEIWPYGTDPSSVPIYSTLCKIMGIHYISWINKDIMNTKINYNFTPHHLLKQRSINDRSMLNHLENLIGTVACCDDPEWLFRINQDTVINIDINGNYKSNQFQDSIIKAINLLNEETLSHNKILLSNRILASVGSILCEVLYQKNLFELHIVWEQPWNLPLVTCKSIFYEVVVDVSVGTSYKYLTNDLYFYKRFLYLQGDAHVWITAICEEVLGNSIYKKCKIAS